VEVKLALVEVSGVVGEGAQAVVNPVIVSINSLSEIS
jgi:hypothetical protein